jgi:hypothetical protein
MVKETEANLPVDWWDGGGNGGVGSNPELADESKRFVLIGGKGVGIIFGEDNEHKYVVCYHHFWDALAGTVDMTYADGTAGTALVIAENKTHGVILLAAKKPDGNVLLFDWAADAPVRTGDTVYLGTPQGLIRAQVLEPYWEAKYPKGILEVQAVAKPLHARLGLPCSKQLLGAGCLTKRGDLTGFVSGRDPETNQIVMVKAGGFRSFLMDTKEAFARIMKAKSYIIEELFVDHEKYEDMRRGLADLGSQTLFGFSYIVKGRGASARIYLIDVPTSVNLLTGRWTKPSYRSGTEVTVLTPANSNPDFMSDLAQYRPTASCRLTSLRWIDPNTGVEVRMREGDLPWAVALDYLAANRPGSFTAKMQWDFADGRPTKTTEYRFDLKKLVEEQMPNGTPYKRPISQLSLIVRFRPPIFVRLPPGTSIKTIDAFLAGTRINAQYGYPGVGYGYGYRVRGDSFQQTLVTNDYYGYAAGDFVGGYAGFTGASGPNVNFNAAGDC